MSIAVQQTAGFGHVAGRARIAKSPSGKLHAESHSFLRISRIDRLVGEMGTQIRTDQNRFPWDYCAGHAPNAGQRIQAGKRTANAIPGSVRWCEASSVLIRSDPF